MSDKDIEIVYRKAVTNDMPFIYNSYIQSSKGFGADSFRLFKDYKAKATLTFNDLIKDSVVTIACASDDANHLFGYSITHDGIVDWIYIKNAYRRFGIATKLLSLNNITTTNGVICTNVSFICTTLRKEFDIILIDNQSTQGEP